MKTTKRITSIDTLRGLVMLFMLLDHVRERFFFHVLITDPTDISTIDGALFWTRTVAHLCAPVFIFLTGLSAWLYENRANGEKRNLVNFLLKRGLFIIALECTLIAFSWFGNDNAIYLQVMWAIGVSMLSLAAISRLPRWAVGVTALTIIFGHNLLDSVQFNTDEWGYSLWAILHDRGVIFQNGDFIIKASYPVLPWIGVISLGYFIAPIFSTSVSSEKRQSWLLKYGCGALGFLLILRAINIYGDAPYEQFDNVSQTVMSFLNFTKYPPSLDFLLLTLGCSYLLLLLFERFPMRWIEPVRIYGNAPMFFYIVHLYVLLILYRVCVTLFGTNQGEYFGFNHLYQIWLLCVLLVVVLYYPTRAFVTYKQKSNSTFI